MAVGTWYAYSYGHAIAIAVGDGLRPSWYRQPYIQMGIKNYSFIKMITQPLSHFAPSISEVIHSSLRHCLINISTLIVSGTKLVQCRERLQAKESAWPYSVNAKRDKS
jgi:hypothetical protein